MTHKQQKITKLLRREAPGVLEDLQDIEEEIERLQQKLKEKEQEIFRMQRKNLTLMAYPVTRTSNPFVKPQKIVLANTVEALKAHIWLTSVLTGVEVQSYELGEQCSVNYHMQHDSEHAITHGLKIDMQGGSNVVSKTSMPLGFNLDEVLENFDNIMVPECLGSVRTALVAYYDRKKQYDDLKKMLNVEAQLFKILDGSHIEITIDVHNVMDQEEDQGSLTLVLEYRVYDIRPKQFSFKDCDNLPENALMALKEQCAVFKKKPLRKAFKEVFITGIGPYKLVQQVGNPEDQQPRRAKRLRTNKHYNNDDTFQPEDCSGDSDGGDD